MSGSKVPRNTRWSFTQLVADFGEEAALEMLRYQPGLGQFREDANVTVAPTEARPLKRNPGDWMPYCPDLTDTGKRIWHNGGWTTRDLPPPLEPRPVARLLSRKERNDG